MESGAPLQIGFRPSNNYMDGLQVWHYVIFIAYSDFFKSTYRLVSCTANLLFSVDQIDQGLRLSESKWIM